MQQKQPSRVCWSASSDPVACPERLRALCPSLPIGRAQDVALLKLDWPIKSIEPVKLIGHKRELLLSGCCCSVQGGGRVRRWPHRRLPALIAAPGPDPAAAPPANNPRPAPAAAKADWRNPVRTGSLATVLGWGTTAWSDLAETLQEARAGGRDSLCCWGVVACTCMCCGLGLTTAALSIPSFFLCAAHHPGAQPEEGVRAAVARHRLGAGAVRQHVAQQQHDVCLQ